MDAERRFEARAPKNELNDDFKVAKLSDPSKLHGEIFSNSEDPMMEKSVGKLSSIFDGLKLCNTSTLMPILDGEDENEEVSPMTPFVKLEKIFSNVTDDGDLKKMIAKVGNGRELPLHALVWVDYEMWGDGMDDVIYRTRRPFKFRFFQPDIMTWLDLGVSTMEEQEKAWFLVKPKLGFREMGIAGVIPPDTTLLVKVHVHRFETAGQTSILKMSESELQGCKYEDIMNCVNELKNAASRYVYRAEPDWRSAYDLYRKAAYLLGKYFVLDDDADEDMLKNTFNLHNNMTLCAVKLMMYDRAIFHSDKALQLPEIAQTNKSSVSKLFYRRAIAEMEGGDAEVALAFTLKAKKYCIAGVELESLEQRVRQKLKSNEINQKALFKKMMSFASHAPVESQS